MPRPSQFPRWADVDPDENVVEPPENKKDVGWVENEKPPARFFNWLFYNIYRWVSWLSAQVATEELRSNNPLTWDGSDIGFTAPIQIVSRTDEAARINQILAADSPLELADGEVLVVYLDQESASPVTLTAGTYGTLAAGQYAIVDEASLDPDNAENELVIFRRRDVDAGDDEYGVGYAALEIPLTSQLIINDSRFYLGGKNFDGQNVYDGGVSRWYSDNGVTPTVTINGENGTIDANNLPPVGSVIGFWESALGLTFNSEFWAFMDGHVVADPESPLSGVTLPDTSGRYLVGFGTDGGGDIDTAAFAATVVGNAGHQVDLQHSHTVAGHSHTVNAHTHTGPSHTHTIGTSGSHDHDGRTSGMATTATETSPDYRLKDDSGWTNRNTGGGHHIAVDFNNTDEGQHDHNISTDGSHNHGGATGSAGTGATGSASPGTSSTALVSNNSLTTTQSIQPRSIRVRWIIRIK